MTEKLSILARFSVPYKKHACLNISVLQKQKRISFPAWNSGSLLLKRVLIKAYVNKRSTCLNSTWIEIFSSQVTWAYPKPTLRTIRRSQNIEARMHNWWNKELPGVKRTTAFRQAYSAGSTCMLFSLSICSCKILMWSMKGMILSWNGAFCIPAAASRCVTWMGMGHCAVFKMNSSFQLSLSKATWSATPRSGKNGMLLAHSTAENNSRAASSQTLSIPMT